MARMEHPNMNSPAWRVLCIGNLSMNKFWGEADRRRGPHSTSVLIEAGGVRIVVDPSWPPEQMAEILDRRRGIGPDDIDFVFLTHRHGDHWAGLEVFESARRLMAERELELWREEEAGRESAISGSFHPAEKLLPRGIELIPSPGHTPGHASLRLEAGGLRVVIAGDAVMTREFFEADEPFHNAVNMEQAVESIRLVRREADIIVPGHDNCFLVSR